MPRSDRDTERLRQRVEDLEAERDALRFDVERLARYVEAAQRDRDMYADALARLREHVGQLPDQTATTHKAAQK